jgi:hypothetical protein
MAELHDHLRTEKASGLFATGGPWESQLMSCVRGELGMTHLVALWEDMKAAVQVGVGAWVVGWVGGWSRRGDRQGACVYCHYCCCNLTAHWQSSVR